MSVFKKFLVGTVLVVSAFMLTVSAFSLLVQAENENLPEWARARILEQAKTLSPAALENDPIEEMMFSSGAQGCADRLNFVAMTSMFYAEGEPATEMAPHPEVLPIVEGVYKQIREDGLASVAYQTIKDFDACFKKESNASDNVKECAEFNSVILETINTLKKGRSVDPLVEKLVRNPLNLEHTSYAKSPEAPFLMLSKFAKNAQENGADGLGFSGMQLVTGCF